MRQKSSKEPDVEYRHTIKLVEVNNYRPGGHEFGFVDNNFIYYTKQAQFVYHYH